MINPKPKYILLLATALCLFSGCREDLYEALPAGEDPIVFGYHIEEAEEVRTRSDLDSIYIASDPFDMEFFIQLNTKSETGEDIVKYGTYEIPSGYEGRLRSVNPDDALDWQNLKTDHVFYSWTIPWDPDYVPDNDNPMKIEFYNSAEQDGFDKYHNNAAYENFVGARSVPHSYENHGKYVDLTFYHLVSKIKIGEFILVQGSGAIQEDLKADITFVGMPTAATFYPHPREGDPSGAPKNSRPYVGLPWDVSENDGVTYFIDNDPLLEDWFYICPEIDFSNIDFKVKINSIEYAGYDTYYGTFDDVVFERTPGSKYDNADGTDSKILHAGEMMTLKITLIPGIGPGLKVVITDWSTDKPTESRYHTYPGMYSDAEMNELLDVCLRQTSYYGENPKIEQLWDLYGEEVDGEKYFYIYENVTLYAEGSSTQLSNIFPVPDGYIINGMGHTVTMKSNGGIAATGYIPYFNVGPVRDIYLTDGNYTIYIDPDGYVWTQNEDGDLVNSGNQLGPLTPPQKGYDINIRGDIRYTNYYNNHVAESETRP